MTIDRRRAWLLVGAATLVVIVAIGVLLRPGSSGDGAPSAAPSGRASSSPVSAASPTVASSSTPSPVATAPAGSATPTATPAATGTPTATAAPTIVGVDAAGEWAGTWTNTQPDTASGQLRMSLTQTGADLEGTVALEGNACALDGVIQGAVQGAKVELRVTRRDQVQFVGTIAGNTMTGTFTSACDSSAGTWQVRRGG